VKRKLQPNRHRQPLVKKVKQHRRRDHDRKPIVRREKSKWIGMV
jgi:hypothetical protein